MKRTLLIVLLMMLLSLPAFAQEAEVRSLSDAQLRELYETVKAEMSRGGLDAVEMTLAEGRYIKQMNFTGNISNRSKQERKKGGSGRRNLQKEKLL